MRAVIVIGVVIVAASSCLTTAEARGRRGGGGGWNSGSPTVWINGYTKRDGTSVAGHYRTRADGDLTNNFSYRGSSATPGGVYTRTASADPTEAGAAVASLPQPAIPAPPLPWCSDGTIVSGFCILN